MASAQLFLPQPPPVPGKAEQGKKEAFQAGKPSAMCCCCIRHQKGSNKCSTFDEIYPLLLVWTSLAQVKKAGPGGRGVHLAESEKHSFECSAQRKHQTLASSEALSPIAVKDIWNSNKKSRFKASYCCHFHVIYFQQYHPHPFPPPKIQPKKQPSIIWVLHHLFKQIVTPSQKSENSLVYSPHHLPFLTLNGEYLWS